MQIEVLPFGGSEADTEPAVALGERSLSRVRLVRLFDPSRPFFSPRDDLTRPSDPNDKPVVFSIQSWASQRNKNT